MFGTPEEPRYFAAPEIWDLIGQTVDVRYDPVKLGEILVFKDGRFICKAENRELLKFGASEETLERARKMRRDHHKRIEERMNEILARAQYKDPVERAAAEERHENMIAEERTKIAAGAEARTVELLLPEAAKTVKKLRAVTQPTRKSKPAASRSLDDDDELKSLAELFKPVENPWADDDDDELKSSAELFKPVENPWDKLERCDDCTNYFEKSEIKRCPEREANALRGCRNMLCSACVTKHPSHRNPWLEESDD
jgi:hypothetical protein